MNFNDIKYSQIKSFIESQYNTHEDWKIIKDLSFFSFGSYEERIEIIKNIHNDIQEEITPEFWNELVDFEMNKGKEKNVIKLGRFIKNDVKIPNDKYSSWQLYKTKLLNQNWSVKSVDSIKRSTFEILQFLSMSTENSDPIKGLVIGNVQSGKTANMAGLMAMAADNGFNYFIVLSGVIENLRQQTSNRLYNDMNTTGTGNLHWNQVDNPSIRSIRPEHQISNFNLGPSDKDRYFSVCLKNKGRLEQLIKWLFQDKNKAKQLKILVIDDEADQASVNTKSLESEELTTINNLIRKLVNTKKVKGMNYVSYTATPYANVLNETDNESLYPKDFIILLDQSEDYIGPKQLFGSEEPERSPNIDIVKDILDRDKEIIKAIQEGKSSEPLPISFKKSIQWFLLSVASMRALDYEKPISMLIHTSFRISHHEMIARRVNEYLYEIREKFEEILPTFKDLYFDEKKEFQRSHFLKGMENYSTPNEVPNYPEWEIVRKYLFELFNLPDKNFVSHIQTGESGEPKFHEGIHLVIDNSKTKAEDQIVRLVYPSKKQLPKVAPAFIIVGGNTLSRGLTLEGLTTSFFLRTTNQADTLMQMGRWFGYRKGYEIFPRVWLDKMALERYQFLSQMNEELREEINVYADNGLTPLEYAPRIKNSPNYNLIRITSNNKMQSAKPAKYNFAGFNTQTIYFENDEEKLTRNLETTQVFLNNLDTPEINKNKMIWRNVETNHVKHFLEEYIVCDSDIKMSSLPALIEWVEKNSENLSNWNIVFSSIEDINNTENLENDWNIHGFSPKVVRRTKLKNRSTDEIANIGVLRTPSDLLADIKDKLKPGEKGANEPSVIQKIREKYNYGNVPQLIIYRINKGSESIEEFERNNPHLPNRNPLNFPKEPIGINILIPGTSNSKNLETYISAQIQNRNHMVDEDEYKEEE
nr:Z1 domain-containing protein [Mammaliicoccus sp. Marseille-Q6498]